jgi:hypothetical protein
MTTYAFAVYANSIAYRPINEKFTYADAEKHYAKAQVLQYTHEPAALAEKIWAKRAEKTGDPNYEYWAKLTRVHW